MQKFQFPSPPLFFVENFVPAFFIFVRFDQINFSYYRFFFVGDRSRGRMNGTSSKAWAQINASLIRARSKSLPVPKNKLSLALTKFLGP